MLISHTNKFIFIHNYKVAGTSIHSALMSFASIKPSFFDTILSPSPKMIASDFLQPAKGVELKENLSAGIMQPHLKIYTSSFPSHIKAVELREKIPAEIFNSYFKFGFVRNPWDWQVSLYNYMLKEKRHHQHKLIASMKNFDEYIEWRINENLRLQKEFFYDKEGNLLMDFIGKYENLVDDFSKVCQKIHIKTSLPHLKKSTNTDNYLKYYNEKAINLVYKAFNRVSPKIYVKASLPSLNQSKKANNYLRYYNERTINLVYEAFKEDIEIFGYHKPVLVDTFSASL